MRLDARKSFLWVGESADRASRILQGAVLLEPAGSQAQTAVPDGIVHDWVGCIFLPGVPLDRVMALMRDYNHQQDVYKPEVVASRILAGGPVRVPPESLRW